MNVESKVKGFWQRPEGKTGIIVTAILIVMGFIGVTQILAFITTTLHILMLLGAVGLVLFTATRPSTWILYKLFCRKLTSFIVKIDPLEILKIKVREMETNLEKVGECLSQLRQTITRLVKKIQQNDASVQQSMEKASYAKKQGIAEQTFLETRKAGRREKSNLSLKELLAKIETMHRVLTKIHSNSNIIISDTKDEIDVTQEEYVAVKAAHSAMKSAMSIINGNSDKRAIYEMAYEQLADDISSKTGDLAEMLETSKSLMENIDLENGMLQENGLKMLDDWEKKADSWLSGSSNKNDAISRISGKPIPKHYSPEVEQVIEKTNNNFSQLF